MIKLPIGWVYHLDVLCGYLILGHPVFFLSPSFKTTSDWTSLTLDYTMGNLGMLSTQYFA